MVYLGSSNPITKLGTSVCYFGKKIGGEGNPTKPEQKMSLSHLLSWQDCLLQSLVQPDAMVSEALAHSVSCFFLSVSLYVF